MKKSRTTWLIGAILSLAGCSSTTLSPWHTERLSEEFRASKSVDVKTFADYLALEERLFAELQTDVYSKVDTGPAYDLVRYSSGSSADPLQYRKNWNRTTEMPQETPVGGVLLLHGMSDSPYSLHTLAETLAERGYWVIALRLPGHGTAPSALRSVRGEDMIAAVKIAMSHLASSVGDLPVHIIGYSTGAALALDFSLDALDGTVSPVPASLVLVSPAIRVHGAAAFASVKDNLSAVPGLSGLTWLNVMPEFDPYKYNSFATNAGDVVHRLTQAVDRRIAARANEASPSPMPPILAFKSTVDATVTTDAIVDNLLSRLEPNRHELVLFDINRLAAKSKFLVSDPGPLTDRLIDDDTLSFGVTVVGNVDTEARAVIARHKAPYTRALNDGDLLDNEWPTDVYSLSHIALPFAPDDPLYGAKAPQSSDILYLGEIALRGERDLYNLPGDWLLRMRYNPFYEVVESRTLEWLEAAGNSARAATP